MALLTWHAAGLDLARRYGDLADNSRIVYAAPGYLIRNGTPAHPVDLESHNCLLLRFGTDVDRAWPFEIDGGRQMVTVRGDRIANDGDLVRRWALEGRGIVRKSQWDVHQDIAAGRLSPLSRELEFAPIGLQAVMPAARTQPRRVRALLDIIVACFRDASSETREFGGSI